MKRICCVITARPSYSRIKTALDALRARPDIELQIVAAASALLRRHGEVVNQIRADGFTVAAEIPCVVEGDGTRESALSVSLFLAQITGALERLQPDVVVTIADRHETLATAIAASYQNIPLCHIQGGEVTGSIDDKVRNAVTALADLHLVATEQALLNVSDMVGGPRRIHVTGCPSIDIADQAELEGPIPGHNIVVLQHPVTTEVDQAAAQIRETIKAVEGEDVLWFWPGEDAGADAMSKELRLAGIKPKRSLPPREFLRLLMGSGCLVGNSSVGIRECSFLGVPVVNIGSRQKGRERGANVVDVPHDADKIREAVKAVMWKKKPTCTLYGDGHAGERIAAILAGKVEAVA